MSKKLVELKPCPFCGGEATRFGNHRNNRYSVACKNDKCVVRPSTLFYDRQCDATKAWNKRCK